MSPIKVKIALLIENVLCRRQIGGEKSRRQFVVGNSARLAREFAQSDVTRGSVKYTYNQVPRGDWIIFLFPVIICPMMSARVFH